MAATPLLVPADVAAARSTWRVTVLDIDRSTTVLIVFGAGALVILAALIGMTLLERVRRRGRRPPPESAEPVGDPPSGRAQYHS